MIDDRDARQDIVLASELRRKAKRKDGDEARRLRQKAERIERRARQKAVDKS